MPNAVKKYETIALALLATWVIYNLFVLLKTGFISDDAYNSQIKGAIIQQGVTLHERILSEIAGWIQGAGRFLVVGWYMTYATYYYTQDTVVVKAITIAIILCGILLFYFFSKRETGSSSLALLACFTIPVFFQFRLWHDPILAFTFLIPIIFALTTGALILFQKYLDTSEVRYWFGAAFVFLIALLTYEIAYPLCLIFLVVAFARSRNVLTAIKQSLPFTGLVALILGMSAAYRLYFIKNSNSLSTYPGAELHLELGKLVSAFEIQTSATIPLSYYFFNKEHLNTQLHAIDYLLLALFWGGIAVLIHQLGKSTAPPKLASWVTSGIILLFIPAALSSLSGHQVELNQIGYGFGYITVYLQYFGLCIFTMALVAFICRKIKGRWLVIFAILVGAGFTVVAGKNLKLNRAVALKSNETYQYPRQLLKSALEAGIADEMKNGAFLFRTMRYPSDWMWFYTTVTGKTFETCELSDTSGYKTCMSKIQGVSPTVPSGGAEVIDLRKQQAWILSYNFGKKDGEAGRVILGKVDKVIQNGQSKMPIQIISSQIRIYDLKSNQVQRFNLDSAPINFLNLITSQSADISEVAPFDPAVLQPSDVAFEWAGEVYGREGTDKDNLRWSSGSATLTLHNLSHTGKYINLSMEFGTPTTPRSNLSVQYGKEKATLTLSQARIPYSKKIFLSPGSTEIKFTSDGKPIQNGDPRNIVFGIFNFNISAISTNRTTHN